MLCKSSTEESLSSDWGDYLVEPKHDGARAVISKTSEGVKIYSRSGREFTEHLPHLVEQLDSLPDGTVVDGEIGFFESEAEIRGSSTPVFSFNQTMRVLGSLPERGRKLQEEKGLLSLVLFDVMYKDGKPLLDKGFEERREVLETLKLEENASVNPVFETSRLSELYAEVVGGGIEGLIFKNTSGLYVPGGRPNKTQYKIKKVSTADVIISGYRDGAGKFEGLVGSIEFSRFSEDGLVFVGRCSGMTDEVRKYVSEHKEVLLGRVIEVKFNDLVGSKEYRSPRHPNFVRFRDDKSPEECLGEEFR